MDPHYMDFGEVDFPALYPTTQKEVRNKSEAKLFRLVNVLGLGSSLVEGRVQFGSLLLKTDHINYPFCIVGSSDIFVISLDFE